MNNFTANINTDEIKLVEGKIPLDLVDRAVEILTEFSKQYYKGTPLVSNQEFDILYQQAKKAKPDHPYFQKVNPEQVNGKVIKHMTPMLSLETEVDSSFEALQDFDRRVKAGLGYQDKVVYILELKYDGLGLNLKYEKGHFKHATTRGDGEEGEDVSHCIPLFNKSIPMFIPGQTTDFEVRGEAMMTQAEFLRINELLESEGKPRLVNPRNAVAGTVRTKEVRKVEGRELVFFPYSFGGNEFPSEIKTQAQSLEWLNRYFTYPKTKWNSPKLHTSDVGYLYSVFQAVGKLRPNLGFAIDGIVYKVNDFEEQKKLGFRAREPRWAVAQKYPPEAAETLLLDIDVQIGRTGKATPVARLEPIYVGGTTITNVTLHNVFDIRRRGIRIGDTVVVQRAGDVIPEIAYRYKGTPRTKYLPNFKMPSFCPCCEGPLTRPKEEADYFCTNLYCQDRVIGSVLHFVSRPCMDIKGLGEETIRNLVEAAVVFSWFDLYRISAQDYIKHGGLAPSNADKVMFNLEKSKTNDFHRFIHGLGIPNVGAGTSKRIAAVIKPFEFSTAASKLQGVPDIGEITIDSITRYFGSQRNGPDYLFFIHSMPGVKFKLPEEKGTKLQGKIILFTGSFKTLKRDDLKALVENNGGKVGTSVTSNVSFVVAGEGFTKHKVEKAESLGKEILTEQNFLDMLK